MTETCTNILFLMKTKNGHILTFSEKCKFLPFHVLHDLAKLNINCHMNYS